jgi:hypothetical protein
MTIVEQRTKYLTDLLGLEHHLVEALGRQREDQDIRRHTHVNELVIRTERSARDHYEGLKTLAASYGIEESTWKKAMGTVLGAASGLVERARDPKLSRVIRDNYVVLSIAAMQYTSAHAFAMATRDERLAAQSLANLMDITPLLVALSKVLPEVVVEETALAHGPDVDIAAGKVALQSTQKAWASGVTESV